MLSTYNKTAKKDFFLTNNFDVGLNKVDTNKIKEEIKRGPYIDFLELASTCFGKDKHYKERLSITQAYRNLKYVVSNLKPADYEDNNIYDNIDNNEVKNIDTGINNNVHENLNSEFQRDFKVLAKIRKLTLQKNNSSSFLDKY